MAAVVISLIAACSFNLRTVLAVIGGAGSQFEQILNLSPAVLGSVSTISILGIAAGSVAAHHVTRRVGLWRAVQFSLIGTSGALGLLLVENLWAVLASVALSGFFAGATGALLPTVIRRFLKPSQRGAGVATMMTLTSVGSLCASILIAWSVATWAHWRPATFGLLAVSVAFALMWSLATSIRTPRPGSVAEAETRSVSDPETVRTPLPRWVIYLTGFFTVQSAMVFAQVAWLVPSLNAWGVSSTHTATLFSILTGIQVLGGFAVPLLAQRSARPTAMIWITAGLVAAGTAGVFFGTGAHAPFGVLLILTLILATGHGGVFAIVNYVLSEHSADSAATTRNTSFTMGVSQLLGAAGPLLFGVAIDAWGVNASWTILSGAGASLLILAALLVRSLNLTPRGVTPQPTPRATT